MSVPRLSFPPPRPSPRPTLAPVLIAGALAALAGAGVWTGIVVLTNTEIGWVAWGVGGLVGFVMSRFTSERGVKLGVYAAGLAVVGLAIGKVATVRVALPTVGRDLILENPLALVEAFALDMRERERFSPELSVELAALSATDSIPERVQARMLDEAQARMAGAPEAERVRVATSFTHKMLDDLDLTGQFGLSLSPFDLLWFGLAIATAFRIMRGS
jgi:hypothetical protein